MSFVASTLSADTGLSATPRRSGSTVANKLNLVSLMDIFTILVFFLMMNSGDVEVLQADEKIILPQSFTQLKPDISPVIKVTANAIYFKEVQVMTLDDLTVKNGSNHKGKDQDKTVIDILYTQLMKEKLLLPALASNNEGLSSHSISVMGDASVPYALLKKVLYTCAQAGFRDVSLAVEYSSRDIQESSSNRVLNSVSTARIGRKGQSAV